MEQQGLSRWQKFYEDNSTLDDIPPSACAKHAARLFSENNSQIILDLGCGTGRDTFRLAGKGVQVIGLDAARSGLALAKKRIPPRQFNAFWVESDSRSLPFSNELFDGVYCFGLLHEFTSELAKDDVRMTMDEIHRVLKPSGIAVVAAAAGDPEKGLPHVQNFSEAMFDTAITKFRCTEKKMYDDLGCTGRSDYKVWVGYLIKN